MNPHGKDAEKMSGDGSGQRVEHLNLHERLINCKSCYLCG